MSIIRPEYYFVHFKHVCCFLFIQSWSNSHQMNAGKGYNTTKRQKLERVASVDNRAPNGETGVLSTHVKRALYSQCLPYAVFHWNRNLVSSIRIVRVLYVVYYILSSPVLFWPIFCMGGTTHTRRERQCLRYTWFFSGLLTSYSVEYCKRSKVSSYISSIISAVSL